MHLVIDGYGAEQAILENADTIYQFLDQYPDAIGMTKITPPPGYIYEGQKPEDVGVSGFVLIAESHISVHTFPKRQYINIDVFSCKDFDTDLALQELKTRFGIESARSWTLERGLEYADPDIALQEMHADRDLLTKKM